MQIKGLNLFLFLLLFVIVFGHCGGSPKPLDALPTHELASTFLETQPRQIKSYWMFIHQSGQTRKRTCNSCPL